jgi:hypothetical protein
MVLVLRKDLLDSAAAEAEDCEYFDVAGVEDVQSLAVE